MADTEETAHSRDLGPLPRMEWIPKERLTIDVRYQRDLSHRNGFAKIADIVEHFSWSKFQPPSVAQMEDGNFSVVDGQRRTVAACRHPLVTSVPCYVIGGADLKREAESFVAINRDRVALTPLQIFHAAVHAGEPDAVHLKEVCDKAGVVIPRNTMPRSKTNRHYLQAPRTVLDALKLYGDGPVIRALKTMVDAGMEIRRSIFLALVLIHKVHRDIDQQRLVTVLAKQDAKLLENAALRYREMFSGATTEGAMRAAIVREFNKGLGAERRLPES